jgi:hypothetical protein
MVTLVIAANFPAIQPTPGAATAEMTPVSRPAPTLRQKVPQSAFYSQKREINKVRFNYFIYFFAMLPVIYPLCKHTHGKPYGINSGDTADTAGEQRSSDNEGQSAGCHEAQGKTQRKQAAGNDAHENSIEIHTDVNCKSQCQS